MKINNKTNSQKWDSREKHYETLLAKCIMLQDKATHLASIIPNTQSHTNDKSSLVFLLGISVSDNTELHMMLRKTIGELLRTKISMCRFSQV